MNHLFAPYIESLELKKLGFDEPCLALFDETHADNVKFEIISSELVNSNYNTPKYFYKPSNYPVILTPTWSQVFDWFRTVHNLQGDIWSGKISSIFYGYNILHIEKQEFIINNIELGGGDCDYSSYPEARLACVQKLIEIIKNKKEPRP